MERATIDVWVGIFVMAGAAALVFLAMKVGNLTGLSSGEQYVLNAHFGNVGGLKVRAPVKSAGVVVGRVADIQYDNTRYDAKVTFRVDSRFKFPKDTSAAILTSGLLGEQYIGLEAGGDEVLLKDGSELKMTQPAVVLEKLISQFLYNKAAEGGDSKK